MSEYPSPEDFLINTPLYETVEYAEEDITIGGKLYYFDGTVDSFCPECGNHTIFKRIHNHRRSTIFDYEDWVNMGEFSIVLACSRNDEHRLKFIFEATGGKIQKIGQSPSLATIHSQDLRKYRNVISSEYLKELNMAFGLASHGVGVGSFIYLRRVFELLVEEARELASKDEGWDQKVFIESKMKKRITLLSKYLPSFLVDNAGIYSILSKGVHELSEEECLNYFPAMKTGIELILDEKVEADSKKVRLIEAKKAIDVSLRKIKT
jgi:predicted RNA-binding Zn-ribbon protein involved in translation (DUF1610 family)